MRGVVSQQALRELVVTAARGGARAQALELVQARLVRVEVEVRLRLRLRVRGWDCVRVGVRFGVSLPLPLTGP